MASESFSNVPASTSSAHRASYSSAEPSHQWIAAGFVSSAISSTQESSLRCFVETGVSSATFAFDLSRVCQCATNLLGIGQPFRRA